MPLVLVPSGFALQTHSNCTYRKHLYLDKKLVVVGQAHARYKAFPGRHE